MEQRFTALLQQDSLVWISALHPLQPAHYSVGMASNRRETKSVILPRGFHPFPSRTRKLSPAGPMVLHGQLCGRLGRRRHNKSCIPTNAALSFCLKVFIESGSQSKVCDTGDS